MDQLISEFRKNSQEVVRVSLTEFKGHQLLDLRVYYEDDAGELKPSRKGVALSVDLYAELRKAVLKAGEVLSEAGILEDLEE